MRYPLILLFCVGITTEVFCQRPISLELPLYFSGNLIVVPEPYAESMKTSGGFGAAGGMGVKINPLKHLAIRAGIEFWKNHLEAEYLADYTPQGGQPTLVLVKDEGNYRYAGFYTTVFFEGKSFFVGGGFQFSAISSYKGKITARDGNLVVFDEDNVTTPNLALKNTEQFYTLAMVGFRLGVQNKYYFKPTLGIGIPLVPLFDDGSYNDDFFLAGIWMHAGLITEFVLKDMGARKKLKKPKEKVDAPEYRW